RQRDGGGRRGRGGVGGADDVGRGAHQQPALERLGRGVRPGGSSRACPPGLIANAIVVLTTNAQETTGHCAQHERTPFYLRICPIRGRLAPPRPSAGRRALTRPRSAQPYQRAGLTQPNRYVYLKKYVRAHGPTGGDCVCTL